MLVPNVVTMSSREIAELTGKEHAHVMRDIRGMAEAIKCTNPKMDACVKSATYTGKDGRAYPMYELDKDTCLTLLLGYDAAARFRVVKRWQELENRQRLDTPPGNHKITEIDIARLAADILNMSESGKLGMVHKLANSCGVNTNFLPAYTVDEPTGHVTVGSSEVTYSATALLKKRGLTISTVRFNKELFNAGILEKGKRKNSRGEDKSFWVISDAGLEYGKNVAHPDNPREVAPHWYDEKFDDLLKLLRL